MLPINGNNGEFSPDDGGPPSPGGGADGGGVSGGGVSGSPLSPGTNLWLFISGIPTNEVLILLSNTIPGNPYVLEEATNLLGPWFTNQGVLATNTVTLAQPVPIDSSFQGLFFRAIQAQVGQIRWRTLLGTNDVGDANGSGLDASPALSSDGRTIFMRTTTENGDALVAVDFLTGIPLWTNSVFTPNDQLPSPEQAEFTGSASVFGTNIYTGGEDGNVYSFFADSITNWIRSVDTSNGVYGAPSIANDGAIYVPLDEAPETPGGASPDSGIVRFSPGGSTNWFFRPHDPFYGQGGDVDASIALDSSGAAYFLAEGHRFYCVNAAGQLAWFLPASSLTESLGVDLPDSSPALGKDAIYVGTEAGYLQAINYDGSTRWVVLIDGNPITATPVVWDDGTNEWVYTATFGFTFAAVTNGVEAWSLQNPFNNTFNTGLAAGANGTVYVGDMPLFEGGQCEFMAITNGITSGGVAWSIPIGSPQSSFTGSSPILCPDGTVVIGNGDGYLYSIWTGTPPATTNSAWPMFQHDAQHSGATSQTVITQNECGAPFLYNGTNDGTNFTFQIVGETSNTWNVYSSSDLSNWMQIATGLSLDIAPGSPELSGTNTFTDSTVIGVSKRFYQLANSSCCSAAIGFLNLNILPGTNLISDPFYQVDDNVLIFGYRGLPGAPFFPMNTLDALFLAYDPLDSDAFNAQVLEWNGTGFTGDTNVGNPEPEWANGGLMTLGPGTGALIVNASSNSFPVSFAGLVREQQEFQVRTKTNFLSATAPIAGFITNVTAYIPRNGDIVKRFNPTNQVYVSYPYTSGAWTSGTPFLNVGEGFVLVTTNTPMWTNALQHNVCGGP